MPVIQFIPQTYCRTCHLSTRGDIPRCLHCNQLLQAAPAKAVKKQPSRPQTVRIGVKLREKNKASRSGHTSRGKAQSGRR